MEKRQKKRGEVHMYCDKCGKEVKKGEKFCTSCGNPVTQVQTDKKVNTKKTKKLVLAVMSIVLVVGIAMGGYSVYNKVIYPKMQYEKAEKLLKEGKYQEALKQFESLADYKDARERVEGVKLEIKYKEAEESLANYQYQEALNKFEELGDYKDAKERVKNFIFQIKKRKTEDGTDTYNYEFDDRGNVKKIRVNKGANNFGIWEFQFNENNLPISYVYTEKENGKVSSEQGETYEYDSSQNLIYSEFTYNGTKRITTVYSYDNNGNKTKRIITEYDENGSKYGEYENTYEYDTKQLLICDKINEMRIDEQSSFERIINYEYNDKQNTAKWSYSSDSISTSNEEQKREEFVANVMYKFDIYGNSTEAIGDSNENGNEENGKSEVTYIATGYGVKEERSTHWSPFDCIFKKFNPQYRYNSGTGGTTIDSIDKFKLIDFNGIQAWYVK